MNQNLVAHLASEPILSKEVADTDKERQAAFRVSLIEKAIAQRLFHFAIRDAAGVLMDGDEKQSQTVLGMILAAPLLKPDGLVILGRLMATI
jgi:hypothetical protein